jgi:hypothetical protein
MTHKEAEDLTLRLISAARNLESAIKHGLSADDVINIAKIELKVQKEIIDALTAGVQRDDAEAIPSE